MRFRYLVAPLAGAWIEILNSVIYYHSLVVAPLAGAWIEIASNYSAWIFDEVAPLAGAWIEINGLRFFFPIHRSRSPCGSVD